MEEPDYFRKWITKSSWPVWMALCLILLSALVQFGSFAMNQTYLVGYFGVQPEEVTMSLQITYVAIIPFISLNFRMVQFFQMRSYLCVGITGCMIVSYLSMSTGDFMLFCILRFINGLFLSMISGGMLILIFSRIEKPRAQTVGLSILYSAVLANAVLVGMLVAELCSTVSWKEVYYYLISALLLSLALVLAIIRKDSGHERPQLGKIDLPGMLFFAIFCGCTAYILLFGEKQDWFSDRRILKATFIGLIAILLFVLRERTAEVPLLDLSIFRLGDFLLALILLALYYGLKDSINLLYAYATGPLGWPRERVMLLGLCNVVPLCLSMWATCILMLRKLVGLGFFFIGGFALLSLYHIYTYECLAPDLSFLNLAISFALQGASSGMLFVPIVLLGLSKIPPSSLVTGIVAGAYTRFLVSLAVIALSFALQSHLLGESRAALGTPLSQENTSAWQPPDQTTLPQRVYLQQQFMANKAFFSIFAMSSVAILVVLILIFTLNWIRKRYRYSR